MTGIEQARQADCEMVMGVGGCSVRDAGKAIAALLTNGVPPFDYLELIGRGRKPLRHHIYHRSLFFDYPRHP